MDIVDKRISDMIFVCSEEIVELTKRKNVDAVVNAADPTLMGSNEPGVDKCIHDAVNAVSSDGTKFKDIIRRQLDGNEDRNEKVFRCERGKAVVTTGGNFCRYVIHAVGSIYDGDSKKWLLCSSSRVNILESCYTEIVNILKKYPDIKSVVIPIIGSGNYSFPPELAIRIAIASVGNALVNWKEKDPELFNMASLEEVIFCIYDTDGKEQYRKSHYAEKILKKYKPLFDKGKKVVYQYSITAHLRYMAEIVRYDSMRGYFAIAWLFRFIMMFVRLLFFPILVLKDLIGRYDWQRRRTVVELFTAMKCVYPVLVLWCSKSINYTSGQIRLLEFSTAYMMVDTITYLLLLIILADIQKPSANVIRSMILLFLNYLEVSLDISAIYFLHNYNALKVSDAVRIGILEDTVELKDSWINTALEYTNAGVKFFFMTIAFGYFANHLRQRKFRS